MRVDLWQVYSTCSNFEMQTSLFNDPDILHEGYSLIRQDVDNVRLKTEILFTHITWDGGRTSSR